MIISQRLARSRRVGLQALTTEQPAVASLVAGRMIQIALALYLLPALLVVLLVGCLGLAVLAGSRLLSGPIRAILN
ncbi:MAG TPA: hypothetical protein VHS97_13315 [Isosphaeraceae bacterium]|jgi:hypothetical protein|nr:hypothetical protein [Isosphaeraceae bacterium]